MYTLLIHGSHSDCGSPAGGDDVSYFTGEHPDVGCLFLPYLLMEEASDDKVLAWLKEDPWRSSFNTFGRDCFMKSILRQLPSSLFEGMPNAIKEACEQYPSIGQIVNESDCHYLLHPYATVSNLNYILEKRSNESPLVIQVSKRPLKQLEQIRKAINTIGVDFDEQSLASGRYPPGSWASSKDGTFLWKTKTVGMMNPGWLLYNSPWEPLFSNTENWDSVPAVIDKRRKIAVVFSEPFLCKTSKTATGEALRPGVEQSQELFYTLVSAHF